MKRLVQVLGVLAILVVGFLGYRVLFPDDSEIIKERLREMAAEASFQGNEAPLAKVTKASKLANYFTVDARISIRPWGYRSVSVNGRSEIREAAIGARSATSSLSVVIDRILVTISDDRSSADVFMSLVVHSSRQQEPAVQDFEIEMKRIDGDWLIHQVKNRELIKQ